MSNQRQFTKGTKLLLEQEADSICSLPLCRKSTRSKYHATGDAATIYSNHNEGMRESLPSTDDFEFDSKNGIWLCSTCFSTINTPMGIKNYPAKKLLALKPYRVPTMNPWIIKPPESLTPEIRFGAQFLFDYRNGVLVLSQGTTESASTFTTGLNSLDQLSTEVINRLANPVFPLPEFSDPIVGDAARNVIELFVNIKRSIDPLAVVQGRGMSLPDRSLAIRSIRDSLQVVRNHLDYHG